MRCRGAEPTCSVAAKGSLQTVLLFHKADMLESFAFQMRVSLSQLKLVESPTPLTLTPHAHAQPQPHAHST